MRGASSKVAQERPGDSTQGEAAGGDLELLDGNSGGRDPVPNIELPSDHADEPSGHQDFANFEARAQDSVSGFNENQADEDDEQVVATGQASEQPAAQPFLGFDTGQLPMLIGGGVLLLIGGLAMLSKLSSKSKKKSNTYRAPVEQVDPERKVRGQFKPSERFKKPKPEPEFESETSLGDLPDQVGVSNLVVAQDAPLRVRSTSAGEEFDFSADMDEAEFELFESDELVEAEPEMPEVTNNDGSLSARPPESHQDSNLSFVESPGLLNSHFVRSSTAPVGAAELAYFGSSKRDIHQEKSSSENDEGVLGELGQEFGSELPEEGQSEGLVDQKIGSSQSAADFSDELIDQQPVRANSEDEEAVMNLQDDDSELEFDFDLSEETGIGDSDADFNFELDDDDASVALSQDASDIAIQSDSPAVVDSADEPIVAEPVAELDAVVETQADPTPAEVAVSSADDSAEFADMFEDSSEDLVGLELNAPADVVEQVEVIAATASDMADDVDFSDIELDGSAAVAVAEPLGDVVDAGIGGVVESVGDVVGDAVGGIAETAQGATEAVADAAGGFSNAAKATAVVAGTAGAAAGGGILARLFGWGKNKDIAEPAEDVISETSEQISEIAQNVVSPAEQIVDETFPEGTDNANAIVDAADVVGPDAEAELSLVDGGEIEIFDEAADDEFNFDLQDDDEFSFADPELDADSAEAEKGFSSMDTLREPERLAAGFSSADTIREPENVVEADSDGLGIAALGGTLAAGAAAAFALNTSPADLEEPAESIEAESEPVRGLGIFDGNSDEDAAADSKTSELEAKIEELQQANQKLEESTKTLEEKLEASLAQSEKALQDAEQEHAAKLEAGSSEQSELAAKLEESSKEQAELAAKLEASSSKESELAAELESVKSELSQTQTAAEEAAEQAAQEAAAKASSEKQADLEKLQADLESAQSSTTALNDELKSVKQQLADAVANQAGDEEGMPTGSLMAAAGLGAAGLGAVGLMGSKGDTSEALSANVGDHDDLKKRFEGRLKAERLARKDAQAHLEQAEEQRNEIAKALRELKKEMAELQSKVGQSDNPKKTMSSEK